MNIVTHDYGMFSQSGNDAVQQIVNSVVYMGRHTKAHEGELTDFADRSLMALSYVKVFEECLDTMVRENFFAQVNYELSDARNAA
jgi:hypothetical protein